MRTVTRGDASQVAAPESAAGTGGTPTRVAQLAVVVAGLGLTFVVAIDGAAGWRVVRAVLVLAVTAATVLAIRATGPVVRGVLAFSFGLVATAAGAGIALPRLASDGSTPACRRLRRGHRGRRGAGRPGCSSCCSAPSRWSGAAAVSGRSP